MLAPIPLLDVAGYKRRSKVRPEDVDILVSMYPGFIDHKIAAGTSRMNARLAKRYRVPLGQTAPQLVAQGDAVPPTVVLSGRPTLGCLEIVIEITDPATFQWSLDGGETWTTGATIAASVPLPATGMIATFPSATYDVSMVYEASTPVPEIALGWLASIIDVDFWQRRGANPSDPTIVQAVADRDSALLEIKEAADSKDGLFELPTVDSIGDSAVAKAGPLYYSEASPYVSADRQEREGFFEDCRGVGTYGGR